MSNGVRMKMKQWKTVCITGGSSGIGLALAGACAPLCERLILIGRDEDRLLDAQAKLAGDPAAVIRTCSLDVSDAPSVFSAAQQLIAPGETVDLLINCAGLAHPDHFYTIDYEVFEKTIRTNLLGTICVTKAFLPFLRTGSRIVNVSSMAGFIGTYGYTSYSASKFGIIGFSEALRNELAPEGISVSVLCPPDTDTPQLVSENRTKPPETFAISGNAKLLSPEAVASICMSGIAKGRFMIIPGASGKLIYLLNRLFPGLVRTMMDSIVRKARRKEGIRKRFLFERADR